MGLGVAVASAGPYANICTSLLQTDNHADTSSLIFRGRVLYLTPNQQRQSTEGTEPSLLPVPAALSRLCPCYCRMSCYLQPATTFCKLQCIVWLIKHVIVAMPRKPEALIRGCVQFCVCRKMSNCRTRRPCGLTFIGRKPYTRLCSSRQPGDTCWSNTLLWWMNLVAWSAARLRVCVSVSLLV